jgi:hypothetical protein
MRGYDIPVKDFVDLKKLDVPPPPKKTTTVDVGGPPASLAPTEKR